MKKLIAFLLFTQSLVAQEKFDLVITNGKIINGTGNNWFYGDIGIREGRITGTGKFKYPADQQILDVHGLMIAPGFIDVHTHIEGTEKKTPGAENFIYDGVTSVITGNCGASEVDFARYFNFLDSLKLSVNVATLIGHNDVRRSVMGTANRAPSVEEQRKMDTLVEQAMKQGAVGISTGLIYIPGTYSRTEEIVELARIAAKYTGVYASHMRNEGDSVSQAIMETVTIGKQAGIPVEISHFKVSGQQNWKRSSETLQMVEQARKEGVDVTIDQYPYTASSTSLSTLLPEDVLADGTDSIRSRLQRDEVKKYVIKSMQASLRKRGLKHFSYAVVANYRADTTLNGKSIEEINRIKGRKHKSKFEAATVIEMMLQGGAGMIFHGMSEWDVKNIMVYPYSMFASDASIRAFGEGVPHPRGYGTNARVLAKYVREDKTLRLEEAVRRMTSLPAQKFQLRDRGLLLPGYAADIVIFDPATVQDRSTFAQPHAYSTGFSYVFVNGEKVIDQGRFTGVRSGKVLYGPGRN